MTESQKDKCREIAEYYGLKKQRIQAVQELSELICLLVRRADQEGEAFKAQVLDEVADCTIMLEQIRNLFEITTHDIRERVDFKLERQRQRIMKEQLQNAIRGGGNNEGD